MTRWTFTAEAARTKLAEVAAAPDADTKSQLSALLNNARFGQAPTVTNTLWAMFGVLGKWHSHHNETDRAAHLIPIQDAGLQTHLRTLDIRFSARA